MTDRRPDDETDDQTDPRDGMQASLRPQAPLQPRPPAPPPAPPVAPAPPMQSRGPAQYVPPAPPPAPLSGAGPAVVHPQPQPRPHEPAPLDTAIEGGPAVDAEPPATAMPFETTVLPDVAPDAADAPPFWEPEPTHPLEVIELEPDPPPRTPQPVPTSVFPPELQRSAEPPVDPFGTEQVASTQPDADQRADSEQLSAIDALFGENQFREYTEGVDPGQNPFARQAAVAAGRPVPDAAEPGDPGGPHGPNGPGEPAAPHGISRLQRVLLGVLGGLLAVLALVALFFLGMRLPDLLGPAPAVVAPSASPSPSASAQLPVGPVAPGEYAWNELLGGECIEPYVDPWQETYVVVDCLDLHSAQMVRRGVLPDDITPVPADAGADGGTVPDTVFNPGDYPGEDALLAQTLVLCRASGIFAPLASGLTDAIVQASYPTEEQWDEGARDYYCFATRSSGEPFTGDIALPQPTPAPEPPKQL